MYNLLWNIITSCLMTIFIIREIIKLKTFVGINMLIYNKQIL